MPNHVVSISAGQTRLRYGRTEIFSGSKWVRYPYNAHELIKLAVEHGWGIDDGLPEPKGVLKCREDGRPWIRILVGREPGTKVLPDGKKGESLGYQFHILWNCRPQSWKAESIWVKTSLCPLWLVVNTMAEVRETIVSNAVKQPTEYAE